MSQGIRPLYYVPGSIILGPYGTRKAPVSCLRSGVSRSPCTCSSRHRGLLAVLPRCTQQAEPFRILPLSRRWHTSSNTQQLSTTPAMKECNAIERLPVNQEGSWSIRRRCPNLCLWKTCRRSIFILYYFDWVTTTAVNCFYSGRAR